MCDNFFMAAFGGSFLNHQFLVAAAAPLWNQPLPQNAPNFVSTLDGNGAPLIDGNLTASTLLAPNGSRFAVNTTQPAQAPFRPGTAVDQRLLPINDNHPFLANGQPDPTYIPTIGDRLNEARISWRWYAGGWSDALAGRAQVDPFNGGFQFHHQSLAYFANFAPFNADGSPSPQTNSLFNRDAHLQDQAQFYADLAAGTLPGVSFIKPIGANNEHPGYSKLLKGQQHVASIVHAIQNSPEWDRTLIIVTYDENGGFWDHVAPPRNNGAWGEGNRIPAVVISPLAKRGVVDHTEYNTLSILKTIEERYNLRPLNGLDSQASSLTDSLQPNGNSSFGTAYAERDADSPSASVLIVLGTQHRDDIDIEAAVDGLHVSIHGPESDFERTFAGQINRIEVYAQGGNDRVTSGLSGSDLQIADSTTLDADITALRALLAEWTRTDADYASKVAHLTGASTGGRNAPYVLNADTVLEDGRPDELAGVAGGLNLYFARTSAPRGDKIHGLNAEEIVVGP